MSGPAYLEMTSMSLSVRCHLKRPWFKMSFQRPHLQGQRGQRHGHGSCTHVDVNINYDSDKTPSGWEPNPHPKKHIYQLCDYCYWHFFSTNSHSKASLSLFVQSEENQLRPPEQQGATVAGKKARADQDHQGVLICSEPSAPSDHDGRPQRRSQLLCSFSLQFYFS